jgi:hypothetical protein
LIDSKENCSSATYLLDFKTNEIAPCWFSKALGDICDPIGAKDLNLPVLQSFWRSMAKNLLIYYKL